MYNYFSIETEAAFRQNEREREFFAAEQHALACQENRHKQSWHLAPIRVANLPALAASPFQFLPPRLRLSPMRGPWRRSCLCDAPTTSCT